VCFCGGLKGLPGRNQKYGGNLGREPGGEGRSEEVSESLRGLANRHLCGKGGCKKEEGGRTISSEENSTQPSTFLLKLVNKIAGLIKESGLDERDRQLTR